MGEYNPNRREKHPNLPQRRSIRLKGYDYSQAGLYFITICTKNRACLFGQIENGAMILNDAGQSAQKCWTEIPHHFLNTQLHEHIIMPNHIHGIIEIVDMDIVRADTVDTDIVRANDYSPRRISPQSSPRRISPSRTIGSIIRGYKIGVTKWFRKNHINKFPVGKSVWQRNYWEHIIRDEKAYLNISNYIINNPSSWYKDKLSNSDL